MILDFGFLVPSSAISAYLIFRKALFLSVNMHTKFRTFRTRSKYKTQNLQRKLVDERYRPLFEKGFVEIINSLYDPHIGICSLGRATDLSIPSLAIGRCTEY